MMNSPNRRKLNFFVSLNDGRTRLALPFITLLAFSVGFQILLYSQVLSALNPSDTTTREQLLNQLPETLFQICLAGMVVVGILCLVLWYIYSNRIFGPQTPIIRALENLCEGKFETKIQLRAKDEHKDVAEKVNQLAQVLKEKATK